MKIHEKAALMGLGLGSYLPITGEVFQCFSN